jgi:3-methyl-2-oxobutanoate hydroxymethyltransferase
MKKTMEDFMKKKMTGKKVSMLTAYDFPTAVILDKCNIDSILVGDSLGTNMLGYKSEREVTMDDMIHHTKAVKRGVESAYIIGDMPYMSCKNVGIAISNSKRFIKNGADGVKVEGTPINIIKGIIKNNIDVIGHIGLNPQIHDKKRVIGKTIAEAKKLIKDAKMLEEIGIKMLVLELVPEELAKVISESLNIPTIGIGAGRYCDGQVLVINDLLGMAEYNYKHANKYADLYNTIKNAVNKYVKDVELNTYIKVGNFTSLDKDVYEEIK